MIKKYSNDLGELLKRGDLLSLAAALLLSLATFYFLQALVEELVGPAIASIFSEPNMYALRFSANGAEFGYGSVLAALILLGLAVLVVALVARLRRRPGGSSSAT